MSRAAIGHFANAIDRLETGDKREFLTRFCLGLETDDEIDSDDSLEEESDSGESDGSDPEDNEESANKETEAPAEVKNKAIVEVADIGDHDDPLYGSDEDVAGEAASEKAGMNKIRKIIAKWTMHEREQEREAEDVEAEFMKYVDRDKQKVQKVPPLQPISYSPRPSF